MGYKHVDNAVKARFALPRSAYEALQGRATNKGQTLSEYLRDLVERDEVGLVGDVGDGTGEITPEELRRMGSDAVREISRRLRSGEAAKVADTSLTKYADWLVRTLEEERLERAKRNPDPTSRYEDNRLGEQSLYESMVGMHERQAMPPARMKELFLDIGHKSAAAAQEFLTYGEQIPDEEVSSNGTVATDVG